MHIFVVVFIVTCVCVSVVIYTTFESVCVCVCVYRDCAAVERSAEFRMFCCMNPATDVGKKLLPQNIRNRMSEFYVDEVLSLSDLQILIRSYLKKSTPTCQLVDGIIK